MIPFSNNELHIDKYKMFRKDRNTMGGGLVIYTRDDIPCIQRKDFESISLESMCIEIKQPNSKSFLLSYFKDHHLQELSGLKMLHLSQKNQYKTNRSVLLYEILILTCSKQTVVLNPGLN